MREKKARNAGSMESKKCGVNCKHSDPGMRFPSKGLNCSLFLCFILSSEIAKTQKRHAADLSLKDGCGAAG
jgi:hypothetical protein